MNMKKIILTLIVIILMPDTLLSGSYSVIFPGGQKRYIKTANIGGSEYLKFVEFKKVFLNESIKAEAYPSSFFLMLRTDDSLKLIQLRRPAIEYKGSIYIPFKAVVHAFDAFLPFRADLKGNSLRFEFLENNTEISKKAAPREVIKENKEKASGLPDISAYRKSSGLIKIKERMTPDESQKFRDSDTSKSSGNDDESVNDKAETKKTAKDKETKPGEKSESKERDLEPVPGRYVIPEGLKIREP